ncbi:hypothetical protein N7U49_48410 (plasmid) [Streptomyces sp. AD2-2]|nr:hypothetical protein N7U49_48410 [Streptomyces sp. AD2-2]
MTRAARAHRAAHERDLHAREPLRELLDVSSRPDSSAAAAAAAEAVRGASRRLLDTPVWEEPQREEGAALAALARLIRLGRQADAAAEILALQEQVVRVLPTCAIAVVMAPELTLSQPEDAGHEPAGDEADGITEPAAETTVEYGAVQPADQTEEAAGHSTEEAAPHPASEPEAAAPARTTAPSLSAPPAHRPRPLPTAPRRPARAGRERPGARDTHDPSHSGRTRPRSSPVRG